MIWFLNSNFEDILDLLSERIIKNSIKKYMNKKYNQNIIIFFCSWSDFIIKKIKLTLYRLNNGTNTIHAF